MANRREFLKVSALGALSLGAGGDTFYIGKSRLRPSDEILGHGDFHYRVDRAWGDLDPAKTPVNNCHEMVMDRRNRLFLLTDHPKNNVIVYDTGGRLLFTWTLGFSGAHGLTLVDEGDAEYLYVTDSGLGKVVMELATPLQVGTYTETMPYRPYPALLGTYQEHLQAVYPGWAAFGGYLPSRGVYQQAGDRRRQPVLGSLFWHDGG